MAKNRNVIQKCRPSPLEPPPGMCLFGSTHGSARQKKKNSDKKNSVIVKVGTVRIITVIHNSFPFQI